MAADIENPEARDRRRLMPTLVSRGELGRKHRPVWVILTACLSMVGLIFYQLNSQTRISAEQQFEFLVNQIVGDIEDRMRQHEQILLGGAGLFEASDEVSRSEWHTYMSHLNLSRNYPGIQGVGFSKIIQPGELGRHIAAIRAEGFPDYVLRPPGRRALYTSVIFLEPFAGRNLAAFGFDMFSEATRHKAMTRAAERHETAISGKVTLVQENQGKVQAGFLMYVPVYRKNLPLTTAEERMKALHGFVFSPYRVDDLMRGILNLDTLVMNFRIFDGESERDDTRMFDSAESRPAMISPGREAAYHARRTLQVYGQTWSLAFESRPEFAAKFESALSTVVLVLGAGISVLLSILLWSLISQRQRAVLLAAEMTREIRQSEQILRETLNFETAILKNAAHAIIATTPEGLITVFNQAAEKLLGYAAEEMINKQTPAVFHDPTEVIERAGQLSIELEQVIEPGFEVFVAKSRRKLHNAHEWTYIRKDGTRCPVSLSITAIEDEDGGIRGFLGMAVDISGQKAAEGALRYSVRYTQAILDNAVDGIITIDEAGRISSFNRAAERIFGYEPSEVLGNNVKMLMPEPYHSEHDGYLQNYRTTGVPKIIGIGREVVGLRKDGSTFPLDLSVSKSFYKEKQMFVGLVRDITERKHTEQMKTEFVSTVSHELRTPLTSISGSLGLIIGGALGELPAMMKPMIDIAHKNSLRLTVLINDLLDMEKLAAGKLSFDFSVQPIMPQIEQSLEFTKAYGDQYQVSFVLEERADEVQVRADSVRLQQVVANFLSNAAKFSPAGGQVSIRVRQCDQRVRVEVIDRGAGIPEEFRSRIFQKFSQGDSSDTRQKGGTGLGLAISKELIERMDGVIGFTSEAGKGSCFYFELPVWSE